MRTRTSSPAATNHNSPVRSDPPADRAKSATPFPLAADIPGRPFIHAHRIALNTRDPEMIEAIEARLHEVRHIEIAEREPFLSRVGRWSYEGIDWFCFFMLIAAPLAFAVAVIRAMVR